MTKADYLTYHLKRIIRKLFGKDLPDCKGYITPEALEILRKNLLELR